MIVDPTLTDMREGRQDRLLGSCIIEANCAAPQQPEDIPLRKFRRTRQPSMLAIHSVGNAPHEVTDLLLGRHREATAIRLLAQRIDEALGIVGDVLGLVLKGFGDPHEYRHESWPAVTGIFREIRAAPKRPCIAIEKHGQRPSALFAKPVKRAHVNRVDVGALLAINFDVDVKAVHDLGSGGILETLVRHDVAPVTRRVADRQKDRFARPLGFGQRFRSPRPPVHWVVLVLQQVRTGFELKAVFGHEVRFAGWGGKAIGGLELKACRTTSTRSA